MTTSDILRQFYLFGSMICHLLSPAGFEPDDGPGEAVRHFPGVYEDVVLLDNAAEITGMLESAGNEPVSIRKPPDEEHSRRRFPGSRFGCCAEPFRPSTFTCSDCREIKLRDPFGEKRRKGSPMEHNCSDCCPADSRGVSLRGLTPGERRWAA